MAWMASSRANILPSRSLPRGPERPLLGLRELPRPGDAARNGDGYFAHRQVALRSLENELGVVELVLVEAQAPDGREIRLGREERRQESRERPFSLAVADEHVLGAEVADVYAAIDYAEKELGGFDIIVNGEHLISWGVTPADVQDAALAKFSTNAVGSLAGFGNVNDHDVGDDALRIDLDSGQLGQSYGQPACVLVIFVQPLGSFLQGNQTRGRNHSGLSHSSAEHLTHRARLIDEGFRAEQHRSNRRTQPLRQAEHH